MTPTVTDEHRKLADAIQDFTRQELTGDYDTWANGVAELLARHDADLEERVRRETDNALNEAEILCLGCAKKENVVIPPRSGIVGLAAVHSSGLICIPNTVRALIAEQRALANPAKRRAG